MYVRRLSSADAKRASAVLTVLKYTNGEAGLRGADLVAFLSRPENIVIAATDGDLPIGVLLAYTLDRVDSADQMICLYEITVAESHRQAGVGRALVRSLVSLAAEMGARKVWTVTEQSNAAAVRLYESAGAQVQPGGSSDVFVWEFRF